MVLEAKSLLGDARILARGHAVTPKHASMANACSAISARSVECQWARGDSNEDGWKNRDDVLVQPDHYRQQSLHAVYWSAFAASQALVREALISKLSEDSLTSAMLWELRAQLRGQGALSLASLGYVNPVFEMEVFDMAGRKPETSTGADFALIITSNFGDGLRCRYLVAQMKNSDDGTASIYRGDKARQFTNLRTQRPQPSTAFSSDKIPEMAGLPARP
ncbi:hypothetical protein IB279_34315 [Ensifer sp. ENS06]|uniref:hypothetical protein n=1 Tax=Ensifer sp. ENS06 TaxID=2769276 RepID=UPI00177EF8B3|nr:hypothetical protein [Ensifer sp. ENS06]MBD9628028.1 hypothetical protein [Ensifer sp. ENS06]